jgi:hypothetical protein
VDGEIALLSENSSDEEEIYTIEWRADKQHWWTNEYDLTKDIRKVEWNQIALAGPFR